MLDTFKKILFLLLAVSITSCTKLREKFGFGKLDSSADSLTLESNIAVLNIASKESAIILKGICETNMNLQLQAVAMHSFKCENESYSLSLAPETLVEGENLISIESRDNASNLMDRKEIKILKDTSAPTVTIDVTVSNLMAALSSIPLSGTCSEIGKEVQIIDSISNNQTFVSCSSQNTWTLSYSINDPMQVNFNFTAQQKDEALNATVSSPFAANKTILGAFTINGVSNTNSGYSGLLRNVAGSIYISWSASTGASKYNITIQRETLGVRSNICQFLEITGTSLEKVISTNCPGMNQGQNFFLVVEAVDSTYTHTSIQEYSFRTKLAPSLQTDANILYVNSDLSATSPAPTAIPYSSIATSPDSSGPFSITVTDFGGLDINQITTGNASETQSLSVLPLAKVSGIFTLFITISDEDGVTSASIPLRLAIVYPYSWAGLIDNNFNNAANFCGIAALKTGCAGQMTALGLNTPLMVDNLCTKPQRTSTITNCAPELSAELTIRSLYFKTGSFNQKTHNLIVGSIDDTSTYFKMTDGTFNQASSTGEFTAFKTLEITGGVFTAGLNSKVTLNTRRSIGGSESFKIANISNYIHNGSTLYLLDPNGLDGAGQLLDTPTDFHINHLVIDSDAGAWRIKSNNLILDGNLILGGRKDTLNRYPQLHAVGTSSKMTVNGNISCVGEFNGGDLTINMASATGKYSSTYAGCKMPLLKLTSSIASLSEAADSTMDLILTGLVITSGTFTAPNTSASSRKLIFRTTNHVNDASVVDLSTGFNPNNGEVVFETADSNKNYKIKLGTMNQTTFSNLSLLSAFYDIQNDFSSTYFKLTGPNLIPLRGLTRTVQTQSLSLGTGLVPDASVLTKIKALPGITTAIYISTTQIISVSRIEITQSMSFTGSSTINFNNTIFDLNTFNLVIDISKTFSYLSSTGTGQVTGPGSIFVGI